jgi:hypothetical protein
MLYPEQPIGTGFSFGKYPENEEDVAADLWQFMQSFYGVFDHLKDHKLFIMGESYAGMYLPSVGRYFHLQNEKIRNGELLMGPSMTTDVFTIPIGGVGIGNGWMNGMIQGPAVIDYSWWHGLIDEPTRDALHNVFAACVDQWNGNDNVELPDPFHSFNVQGKLYRMTVHDLRIYCLHNEICSHIIYALLYIYQDDCGLMWGVLQAAGNPNAYDVTTWVRTCVEILNIFFLR